MGVAMTREEMASLLKNKEERANYMFISSDKIASQGKSACGHSLPPGDRSGVVRKTTKPGKALGRKR